MGRKTVSANELSGLTAIFKLRHYPEWARVDERGKGASLWTRYIVSWTAWNHVRTIAALTALASFIIALR
jgi:uncharacterized membrane protein